MELQLKNIGIIKEANITFDSLTVIGGENDSGKSTISKVLYGLIKTIRYSSNAVHHTKEIYCIQTFNSYIKKLFHNQISEDGSISLNYLGYSFEIEIKHNKCTSFHFPDNYKNDEPKMTTPLFIDTPYIWNILPSLKTMKNIDSVDFEITQTLQDLYSALNIKLKDSEDKIKLPKIASLIDGSFQEDNLGNFVFKKSDANIELINTAMGIKYFGILQVLADKNHFYSGQILFLDEPEVHLHPKWQIELAEVIVYLVKNGVKILVNSHSPFMIEALQRFSTESDVATNFYIADNHRIVKDEQALSKIFEKLSEPFDIFDAMDSELLNG